MPLSARTVRVEVAPRRRRRARADRAPAARRRDVAGRSAARPCRAAPGPRPVVARPFRATWASGSKRRERTASPAPHGLEPALPAPQSRARRERGTGRGRPPGAAVTRDAAPRRRSAPAFPSRRPGSGRAGSSGTPTRSARSAPRAERRAATSRTSRSSVAIVIVSQCAQPPVDGVSAGESGCGWCAYASSRAPARAHRRG